MGKMKEPWIVFYDLSGREIAAYTLCGTFFGELEATIELLASERGIEPQEISFAQITR